MKSVRRKMPRRSLRRSLGLLRRLSGLRLNISSMRSVTRKPPTTLIVPNAIAITSRTSSSTPSAGPITQQAAEQHDPVDRVGARHQRRVQRVRHLGDHLEADEARRARGSRSRCSEVHLRPPVWRLRGRSRRRVTQAPAMISSSKSSSSAPSSPVISSSSAWMLRAYSWEACSAIVRREVQRRDDLHVVPTTVSPGSVQLAVAARLAGEVDDHRAGLHPLTASAVTRIGAGRPGTSAVVITTSNLPIASVSACCWRACCSASAPSRSRPRPRRRRCPRTRGTSRRATRPAP